MFTGWKRLLLSDGPRQTINALTLYSIYLAKKGNGPWYNVSKYFAGNSLSTSALMISTFFTFVIFSGSLLLLIFAGVFYVPLLCYIQGNLKVSLVSVSFRSAVRLSFRNMCATKSIRCEWTVNVTLMLLMLPIAHCRGHQTPKQRASGKGCSFGQEGGNGRLFALEEQEGRDDRQTTTATYPSKSFC